jgi:sugar phosphate isomerase/epimerase
MIDRRKFIQAGTTGMAVSLAMPFLSKASASHQKEIKKNELLKTGMAGYTFLNFNLADSIKIMNRLNVKYFSIKDFHLALNSTPQQIQQTVKQINDAGINLYAVGVIYMKTKEEVDRAFSYAKNAGVDLIVGVPGYDLLDYTEQKVKEYNIKMAIHNHGPQDKLYPGPKDVYDHINKRDKRMGLCIDIGHTQRTGVAPAEAVKQFSDRLFDLHIKDVTAAQNDGKAIEIGRGVIDFDALLKTLYSINYTGVCSIEFEKDMKDPVPGLAESLGYFNGAMKEVSLL